ncbi:MAG: hypothetical protein GX109_01145 [Bacteroidales bacterium]|jgi:hypothetical protein|nr:hypothetical protein [Bacteroidales bacterium]
MVLKVKKFIGLILVVCVLCTGTAYADNYGIIDSTVDANATMTRAEMAKIVVTLLGLKDGADESKGSTTFNDVNVEHSLSGYIHIANQLKVVEGNGDGTFTPNEAVTFDQAVKMIVCALGYKPKAESMGGYPNGYVTVAMQEGVTRGITAKTNEPIKIKDIHKMVDKALTTPVMVQTGFGSVVEYQVFDGENGVAFSTLETRCLNPSSFYVTYKSNNIILTDKDLKSATAVASNTDDLYSLEFTLTEEGKEKLAKATEEILKAPEGENYVKVISGEIIAKPKVVAKLDSGKFVVQGQFSKSKADAIVKAISNYENE